MTQGERQLGSVKLEIIFEEDAEFCKKFLAASYSERVVMLAHVMAKQADGTWLDLNIGRPKMNIYERNSGYSTVTSESGVSGENISING